MYYLFLTSNRHELMMAQISGVKGAKGCFSYTTGHLWPYKLVLHLLKLAISQGVNLQTHTPVERVSSTRDDRGYWTVTTPRGSILAKTIVYASNAYTSAILPEYKNAIIPVRGVCSRIVTPTGKSPHLSNSYIIRLNSSEYDYLIPRSDGSIIVGGARSAYIRDLRNWYDVADDSKVLEPPTKYVDGYMQRNFHGWEESGAYTDKVWTGSK
jgi:glycine/D-amino acid oxidase-like deaminating enzyme